MTESKNDYLKKCFARIVDGMQLKVDIGVIRHIIRKELQVDLNSLNPVLAKALPYFVIYHIKHWPGWSKSGEFYAKKMLFKDWYTEFVEYLKKKLKEAMDIHFTEICSELRIEPGIKSYSDKGTQTDDSIPKGAAPFQIEVFGKPQLLNTIAFTDAIDNGVALVQHRAITWSSVDLSNITMNQLLTWPHVGVHLFSPVLSFSRKNLHKFTRYISYVKDIPSLEPSNFIERIDNFHKSEARACYTADYFKDLASKWLSILSGSNMYFNYLDLFKFLMQQLIIDIEEIAIIRNGKPVLAASSSVLFNIGKGTYLRNKKAPKFGVSMQDLVYTEIIVPMMETTIIQIKNEAQVTRYLGRLKKVKKASTIRPMLPQITFMCTFCNVTLPLLQHVLEHFMIHHKMDAPVMCAICKKNFLVTQLAKDRWRHGCSNTSGGLSKTN